MRERRTLGKQEALAMKPREHPPISAMVEDALS